MTITKTTLAVIVLGAIIGSFLGLALSKTPSVSADNAYNATMFNTASTSQTFNISTSARVLGTTTVGTRVYATICNATTTSNTTLGTVWLRLDADKPMQAGVGGFAVKPSECFVINAVNLYTGAIQASSTNGLVNEVKVQSYELGGN